VSDPPKLDVATEELKRRSADVSATHMALCDAIANAIDAELAYLKAAYAVALAERSSAKHQADINARIFYLMRRWSPMSIGSAAYRIVDTSWRRRFWGF
jgi:ribonuclease PH